jgi:hypothetical protein
MKQFPIKAYHLNPVNMLCLIMLAITMTAVLMSGKSADKAELPAAPVAKEIPENKPNVLPVNDPFGGIENPVPWELTKDFQVQIVSYGKHGRCAIVFDRNRIVRVLPLDNQCNLTFLINHDQE